MAALERELTTLHLQEFPSSTRHVVTVAASPSASDVDRVRRELFRTATKGVHWRKRTERKEAEGWVAQTAPGEAQRRCTEQLVATQHQQASLDEAWNALRLAPTGGAEPIYGGTFSRQFLKSLNWTAIDPLVVAIGADRAELSRKTCTGQVAALKVHPNTPTGKLLNDWLQA